MALDPTLVEQGVLADTLDREGSHMTSRVRLAEISVAVAFVAAVSCLWGADPPDAIAANALPSAVCLLVLAAATRVRIDMPFGFTVPTQLAFVPLLFAMPLALVPIGVVLALVAAGLLDVLRGRCAPSRLLLMVGNSWFSVGPVAVFVLASTQPRHASTLLLIAALAAQFAVDFVASTVRFSIGRGARIAEQLSEVWVYAIDAALSGVGLMIAEEVHRQPVAPLVLLPLLAVLRVLARERRQRLEALLELNSSYRGTALMLGDVVEADDGYTGLHSKGVVALALEVGETLGLSPEQQRNLEFAALLHDVGKIAIPKAIINKPGRLNPEEWALVQTHTVEGQRMLDRVGGFMHEVGLIVRSHHERWDGGGYPDSLVGDAIPLEARIITCCDTWNAMRTDRPYRKALSVAVALRELETNAGLQFDPRIAEVLLRILARSDEVSASGPTVVPELLQPAPSQAVGRSAVPA